MNTRLQKGLVLGGFQRSFAVLALGAPAIGRAQATSGAKSTPQASAATAHRPANRSAGGGMNTGIKVHGHWTINILTKDGKLVSHHEFENSIAYGAPIFANLLAGTATPGGLAIMLGGSVCPNVGTELATLQGFTWVCPIVVAGSAMAARSLASSQLDSYVDFLSEINVQEGREDIEGCALGSCSTTLTLSSLLGTSSNPAAPTLTLSGTYTAPMSAPSGASISAVAVTGYVCSNTVTQATCVSPPASGASVPVLDIYASFPASGGGTTTIEGDTLAITSTVLSTPISVGAGQIIQATVVISFS